MTLMECRLKGLISSLAGLKATGAPLVGMASDGSFHAVDPTDDLGQYYIIPKLALALGLPIETTLDLFWWGFLSLAALSALMAYWRQGPSRLYRAFATLAILGVTRFAVLNLREVYLTPLATALLLVPWWGRLPRGRGRFVLALATGIAVPLANALRIHAGTMVLVFVVASVALGRHDRRTILSLASCLALGCALSSGAIWSTIAQRDAFLRLHGTAPASSATNQHVIWHNIYIGLGYVPNAYGIQWSDTCGANRVAELEPSVKFPSADYDAVLRAEVLRLAWLDPGMVVRNILAKSRKLIKIVVRFANVGLLPLLLWRGGWRHHVLWFMALGFAGLPGLLTWPKDEYLSGLMALSTLYALDGLRLCPEFFDLERLRQVLRKVGLSRSSTGP